MVSPANNWEEYREKIDEAKKRDSESRNGHFLDGIGDILGFSCSPFSVEKLVVFEQAGSPFLGGSENVSVDDILTALWVLSCDFEYDRKKAIRFRKKNFRKVGKKAVEYAEAILAYIQEPFKLTPANNGEKDSRGWTASLVDALASEYGWSEEQILKLPLGRAFQYISAIRSRLLDEPIRFSPEADRLKSEYLKGVTNGES